MSNTQHTGSLSKVAIGGALGKSTLINSSISIPMPSGATPPPPPVHQGTQQSTQGNSAQPGTGAKGDG